MDLSSSPNPKSRSSDLDLSGKLIIKVQLGDDIRRIPIHNEAITYDELVLMMQRVFKGKLSATEDLTIKYKDEDGDLITIFDSSDLSFAIQCSRILKLQILVGKVDSQVTRSDLITIRNELKTIRNHVNKLLDSLDHTGCDTKQTTVATVTVAQPTDDSKEKKATVGDTTNPTSVNPSEFDPLKDKKTADNTTGGVNGESGAKQVKEEQPPQQQQQQQPNQVVVSTSAHHPSVNDYYRSTGYPTQQYTSVPYPQQLYSTSYQGYDPSHSVVSTSAYNQPQSSVGPYPQQPQQYVTPGGIYSQNPANNPYSKTYAQPSPQHGYLPPRQ